jgi:hypothetical protein
MIAGRYLMALHWRLALTGAAFSFLVGSLLATPFPVASGGNNLASQNKDVAVVAAQGQVRTYASSEVASRISKKLTILEASGRLSPVDAANARERLDELSKARRQLATKHKWLSAQDDRSLAMQLSDLEHQIDRQRRRDRNFASTWFNWY